MENAAEALAKRLKEIARRALGEAWEDDDLADALGTPVEVASLTAGGC